MTINTLIEAGQNGARKAGRPRRLTLEMVLDAANEMGIENLSMKKLASELGVGIATIYRYVADRDELVRLALARRHSHPFIVTPEMDWRDVIRGYADSLFSVVSPDSFSLNNYMKGGFGVTAELEFVDTLIEALVDRGFEANEAGRICRMIGHQVGGAAMGFIHEEVLRAAGTNRRKQFDTITATYESDALMGARAGVEGLFDPDYVSDWKAGIEVLIQGWEVRLQQS